MTMHLTVVSYTQKLQTLFEQILKRAGDHPAHRFERCQHWKELPELVLNAGFQVDLLDLVGHGYSGFFELGDPPFLRGAGDLTEEHLKMFKALHSLLPEHAEVRLLGCETGVAEDGLKLLKEVSKALGGRKVSGTLVEVLATDFGAWGLKVGFARRWLVSSQEPQAKQLADRYAAPLEDEGADSHNPQKKAKMPRPQAAPAGGDMALTMGTAMAALSGSQSPGGTGDSGWSQLLSGYRPVSRGELLTSVDLDFFHRGTEVMLAGNGRLVMVKDDPGLEPLLLRWNGTGPAPTPREFLNRLSTP